MGRGTTGTSWRRGTCRIASPSRIRRVTPSWVSAQALVHSSQRVHFLQVEHQQALGVHQPLAEELGQRQVFDLMERGSAVSPRAVLRASSMTCRRTSGNWSRTSWNASLGELHEVDMVERRAGRGASRAVVDAVGLDLGEVGEQADFAEEAAGPEVVQDVLGTHVALGDLHEPGADQVEGVGRVVLLEDQSRRCSSARASRARGASRRAWRNPAASWATAAKIGTLRRWLSIARRR